MRLEVLGALQDGRDDGNDAEARQIDYDGETRRTDP